MRDFIKQTLATLVGLILFVALGLGGLLVIIAAISASSQTETRVEKDSILTLDLSQPILDAPDVASAEQVFSQALTGNSPTRGVTLRSVLEGLQAAAQDDRIQAIYLSGKISPAGLSSGYATLREVRQALLEFQAAGKKIYAYDSEGWSERDYYITSVADRIWLEPRTLLEFNGLNLENVFFAGALQKYGVGVQVLRVGKYKSAVEPFLLRSSSPESQEQNQQLLGDLWSELLTASGQSRQLSAQKLQTIANQQPFLTPEAAKSAGLIDQAAYEDEVLAELLKITGEAADSESFRQISLPEYSQEMEPSDDSGDRIAVVYAEGDIVDGDGGPGSIGGDSLSRLLRKLRQDADVKAIVLRVNSPGGSATASAKIAREVALITKTKPLIASMGSYAASGGYEISTEADRIFASPNTVTGSIGVFGVLPNFQQIANQNGITWDGVKTGQFADINTISRPKTAAEMAIGQRVVDRIYSEFVGLVAESRQLPVEKVAEIAQGRVWSGTQAKKLGLVTDLGGLEDAIQAAAAAAKLDQWHVEEYPQGRSFEAELLGRLFGARLSQAIAPRDPIQRELLKFQTELEALKRFNDPQGVYSRLPFNPAID